jgi:hypothetical protein
MFSSHRNHRNCSKVLSRLFVPRCRTAPRRLRRCTKAPGHIRPAACAATGANPSCDVCGQLLHATLSMVASRSADKRLACRPSILLCRLCLGHVFRAPGTHLLKPHRNRLRSFSQRAIRWGPSAGRPVSTHFRSYPGTALASLAPNSCAPLFWGPTFWVLCAAPAKSGTTNANPKPPSPRVEAFRALSQRRFLERTAALGSR